VLRADHPNAIWLAGLYGDGKAIMEDPALSDEEREERLVRHRDAVIERLSPDFVIHTGGLRLAATGGLAFMRAYAKRRSELSSEDTVSLELYDVLADDHYGITYARFRTRRDDRVWERPGMGAWRFEGGLAVEHWELPDGRGWDDFYLATDGDLVDGDAVGYWSRPAVSTTSAEEGS
jgi:hypothetical protein